MNIKDFYHTRKSQINLLLIGIVIGIVLSVITAQIFKSKQAPDDTKKVIEVTKIDSDSQKSSEQTITVEIIDKKLENLSKLSTAEMVYTGLYSVTEGKIPFLTKKGFSMVYIGNVQAGIDPLLVDVDVSEAAVTVTIPPAEILFTKIDPASIQFYDEKHALFNPDEKTDVTDAIVIAENDLKEKADTDGLLERANQQAKYIIEGILENSIGDKALNIKQTKG